MATWPSCYLAYFKLILQENYKWSKNQVFLRHVVPRIMIRYNKQYIVVKSQYVSQILQYIAIPQV